MDSVCGISINNGKLEGVWKHNLRNKEFCTVLEKVYYEFLINNYGPSSGFTLIKNSAGEEAVTSSSNSLLQQLQFFHPAFKFINALIDAQLKTYNAHSLYVGILCSSLLFRAISLEEVIPYRIITDVADWIQDKFLNNLLVEQPYIHFTLNTGNMNHVLCLVTSLINSKTYYVLTPDEKMHLSIKIAEAFLKTIPEDGQKNFGYVHLSPIEGQSTMKTQVIEGILYRESDYCVEDIELLLKNVPKENLKVLIFNVALSHCTENKTPAKWTSSKSLELNYNEHLSELLANCLKANKVHVLANQKYIHPSIKYNLERKGYIVIERLGTSLANSLIKIAACIPISTLSQIQCCEMETNIGVIPSLKVLEMDGKAYLHIQPNNKYENVTLILTGISSHVLEYLQDCVTSSISILQQMISDSTALAGGGCLEAFAVVLLSQMKWEWANHLANIYDASPAKVHLVFGLFMDAFMHLSIRPTSGKYKHLSDYVIDSSFHHLWLVKDITVKETDIDTETKCKTSATQNYKESFMHEFSNEEKISYGKLNDVSPRCACKSLTKGILPLDCNFVPLLKFKSNVDNLSCDTVDETDIYGDKFKLPNIEKKTLHKLPSPSSVKIIKESVLDYLPAKLNAVRFAFEGFTELFRTGECIFDQ